VDSRNRGGVTTKNLVGDVVIAREIFDRLRQATAADPAILAELCREYVAEARSTVAKLQKALAQRDATEVRERAHYLKGSSLMIGARTLAQCCGRLEQMGRDSDLEAAEPALDQVIQALKAVEDELTKELGSVALPAEGSAA
jgi:HPt (histidine-containing phosphotransfer) domain-containing protein